MNSRTSGVVLVTSVFAVTVLVIASVPFVSNGHNVVTSSTTSGGHGIFLDATMEDFKSAGYVDGDQISLKFEGMEPIYGLFCENSLSAGYFETFVAPDDVTGSMIIDQRPGPMSASYAGTVEISFVKHLDRVEHLTHYLEGKVDFDHSASAQAFCNHREVTVGDILPGKLYRSIDPLGVNSDGRAAFADYFAGLAEVDYEIDLCETAKDIDRRIADGSLASTYCLELYKTGHVLFDKMASQLFNNTAQFKIAFEYMLSHDGSFLIHCIEGKDRTGMFFILLGGLCGATMDEVMQDYMQTMVNFHNIVPGSQEYNTVKNMMFDRIIYLIAHPAAFDDVFTINWEDISISDVDLGKACTDYLLNQVGMTQVQLDQLVQKLTN